MKNFTKENENIAVGWYYLGNSYMNVGMTAEANEAYDKVIKLNTVPRLTAYAVQAQMCISEPASCKYEIFDNADDVSSLVADPKQFFENLHAVVEEIPQEINTETIVEEVKKPDEVLQIERLINGEFAENIHPAAQVVITQEKAKSQIDKMNSAKNK